MSKTPIAPLKLKSLNDDGSFTAELVKETRTPNGVLLAHDDHGLSTKHLSFIDSLFWSIQWDGSFVILSETMPDDCPDLMNALYGPAVGDDPIQEHEVKYVKRGSRPGPSRIVNRPCRPTRNIVVIAGPGLHEPMIFTSFGGFPSQREWWDSSMKPAEALEAAAFWMIHALSDEG